MAATATTPTQDFREIFVHVRLLALWKYSGFEFLVNRSRRFRRFWEFYLCYLIRGKVIEWHLAAVKDIGEAGQLTAARDSGS